MMPRSRFRDALPDVLVMATVCAIVVGLILWAWFL